MVQVLLEEELEMVEANVLVEEVSQALKKDLEQWLAGEKAAAEIKAFLALKVKEAFSTESGISSNDLIRGEEDENASVFILDALQMHNRDAPLR